MPELKSPTPEESLLSNLNDKQLELVLFYLASNTDRGLTVDALAKELRQKMQGAQYKPSGFHITNQLLTLADCLEKYGSNELAGRLRGLVGELHGLMP